MAQQILLRRDTAANWTTNNPVLAAGELGVESDTMLYKIGDGVLTWTALSYPTVATSDLSVLNLSVPIEEPSVPAAGNLKLYPHNHAGRLMARVRGPQPGGLTLQPGFFSNNIMLYSAASGTAQSAFGGPALSITGTASTPTISPASMRQAARRWSVTSSTTASTAGGPRIASACFARQDGFFFVVRFAIVTSVSTQRAFVGLTNSTTAFGGSQVMSSLTNVIGVCFDNGETTLSLINGDGTSSVKTPLGANFTTTNTEAFYELMLYAAPQDTKVGWRVRRLDVDSVQQGVITTTKLPASTTTLTFQGSINNGGTAAAAAMDFMRVYIENDN